MNRRQRARKKHRAQIHSQGLDLARRPQRHEELAEKLVTELPALKKEELRETAVVWGVDYNTKTTKKTLIERIMAAVKS
jgi:hypothetical protein